MKLVEVIQPAPEVIRLFLEPDLQAEDFGFALRHSLGQEKAGNFGKVTAYLESSLGDSYRTLEDVGNFQLLLERSARAGRSEERRVGNNGRRGRSADITATN